MTQHPSGRVTPVVPQPIIKGVVLAGWRLGLRVPPVSQPVSHPFDGICDPVSNVRHVHDVLLMFWMRSTPVRAQTPHI